MSDNTPNAEVNPQTENQVPETQETVNQENINQEPTPWYAEDYAAVIEKKGFKEPNDVLKSYVNLERMVGNSIRIPSEDSSQEMKDEFYSKIAEMENVVIKGKDDFYSKIGRPENADSYNFESILPEGSNLEDINEKLAEFKALAFDAGLNQEQANKLAAVELKQYMEDVQQNDIAIQEGEKRLHEIWGQDYANRLNAAKETMKIYSEQFPAEIESLLNSSAGNNPVILAMFAELGKNFKEQGHVGMSKVDFGMTPEEALSKIAEKKADPGFSTALTDKQHPGHKKAVEDLTKLYSIAYD